MTAIKNTSNGPRGVHTEKGFVLLAPGESRDLDVTEGELKSAKSTGHFEVGDRAKAEPDQNDLGAKTVEELKALAVAEAIDLGENTKKADIIAAIELAREEKAKA